MSIDDVVVLVLGLFFLIGSFFLTGMRGAFSSEPYYPVTWLHKVIVFLIGLTLCINALRNLF